MGVRARNSCERMRTIWEPEMDRYFIDLMLEQVKKGNRIDDHLFSKRAWKQMTSLFNDRFKFQFDKDVLKNRHKTLRNLFKAIKNLLEQKGFSWDQTRQMVTADNKIWDDYIKVHPESRSYRIKTIPYYIDLCEIYKKSISQTKSNICSQSEGEVSPPPTAIINDKEPGQHSDEKTVVVFSEESSAGDADVDPLHDILIDEDYGASGIDNDTPQTVVSRTRTYWQPPMDRYFIDLMLEHVHKGNQVDGLFHRQAWTEMIASFNSRFGFKYDIDILKNRYKTLRRQFNVIKNLLELDGFVWDNTRQMVTADDSVWQDYIKAHTDARQYMTRPVPYYKDLCVICRELSGSAGNHLEEEDEVKYSSGGKGSESVSSEEQESSHAGSRNIAHHRNNKRCQPSTSANSSKKARSNDEGMASALREMATAVSFLADNNNNNNRKEEEEELLSSVSIENVVEEMQALPDMDEDLVLDACDFLEDDKKAKTFLALDFKLRKKWLIRKLRPGLDQT